MRQFSFQRATSEADAIAASAAGARYLAGGTTRVDLMREEVETPALWDESMRLIERDAA